MKDIGYYGGLSECVEPLKKVFEEFEKFSVFREDGNGFYRVFMFSLFEYYILTTKIAEIQRIANDLCQIIDYKFKRYNVVIDKTSCLTIFDIIIDLLQNDDVKNAYIIFCKAILLFPNFDQVSLTS